MPKASCKASGGVSADIIIEAMINGLIRLAIARPAWVLAPVMVLVLASVWALVTLPVDAIPDLTDVQVIVRTPYPGQTPAVIEDQITYPLSTALQATPGAVAVRGFSFFGDSYVYVLFDADTDLYWARSRVLEYLNQAKSLLPEGVEPRLGPDATGLGWIYQYALIDRTGRHDLAQLTSLQNFQLKLALNALPGVAEVATVCGMVKQYTVELDPGMLRNYYLTLDAVRQAVKEGNDERGASVVELAEAEYPITFKGYIKTLDDLAWISVPTLKRRLAISSVPLYEISRSIQLDGAARRCVSDLDGEGEAVGGIVILRAGGDTRATLQRLKQALGELAKTLPAGVELVETYDRADLIERVIDNLSVRLLEELAIVALICWLFLGNLRSAGVLLITLPVGVLLAFLLLKLQGLSVDLMVLSGIAIALGAMADAGVVLVENADKHLQAACHDGRSRLQALTDAATEVGAPLFYSLLIITLSFVPILALPGQAGRLFTPLAFSKTYAMAAAALLSVTLLPALMSLWLKRGRAEENGLQQALTRCYRPLLKFALAKPKLLLVLVLSLLLSALWPLSRMGVELMPEMDEGDLLYMPQTLPGLSIGKARQLLQQTDRLIKTVPEVARVYGKAGRADTATDPAPLTMFETIIRLKPRAEWRPNMTLDGIIQELDQKLQLPGLRNAWLKPIQARVAMQSTGINTPLGLKITGDDLKEIARLGARIEAILSAVPGTETVLADRADGARYLDFAIDRRAAAHFGLSIQEIQRSAALAIGGETVTYTVEGRERYPVQLRYPRAFRDSIATLSALPLSITEDTVVELKDLAEPRLTAGPSVIKSENGRLAGWVTISQNAMDLSRYVQQAQAALTEQLELPPGYSLTWVGDYRQWQQARLRLYWIVPAALLIILWLLRLSFSSLQEPLLVLASLPLALVGGLWLCYVMGLAFSVATAAGFLALAGVAAEFGVVMLVYLNEAAQRLAPETPKQWQEAVVDGAVRRVRPKAMTVALIILSLLPVLVGRSEGGEWVKSMAAPLVGGMLTAPLLSMLVLPVFYYRWRVRQSPFSALEISS